MATTLTEAPVEPTNGDVMIAVETLRNAGAKIENELVRPGTAAIFITLEIEDF